MVKIEKSVDRISCFFITEDVSGNVVFSFGDTGKIEKCLYD